MTTDTRSTDMRLKKKRKTTCATSAQFINLKKKLGITSCYQEVFPVHIKTSQDREEVVLKSHVHANYNSRTCRNISFHRQREYTKKSLDPRKWRVGAKRYTPDLHIKMDETNTEEFYCVGPNKRNGQELEIMYNSKKTKVKCKRICVGKRMNDLVNECKKTLKCSREQTGDMGAMYVGGKRCQDDHYKSTKQDKEGEHSVLTFW